MSEWIACSDKLPPIFERMDQECIVQGRKISPLNRSIPVIIFNGRTVYGGAIEWFDGSKPYRGETHWMPFPSAPE